MLSKIQSGLVILSLFASVPSFAAFFQADLPTTRAQATVGTHIIISGKGLEVGDQWLRAAHTQALLFKDKDVHGAIRVIGAIENDRTLKMLSQWGYQNIQVFEQNFSGPRLNDLLLRNSRIASIDWIGHNGAILGFVLEDYSNRFFLNDARAMAPLAARMTKDSYVRIMGCNTGWTLAPEMAKALRVPVAGTFTFADIQKLHETREWFYHDEGRYPGGVFLKRNEVSYVTPIDCSYDGGCMRLKPVNINYQGKHGNYGGTVPFNKFFCADLPLADCQRRMALSLTQHPSTTHFSSRPSQAQFIQVLADFFCPASKDVTKREACALAISNHVRGVKLLNKTFTTSSGPTITCNMRKCEVVKDCSSGTCVMMGTGEPGTATTFVDELNSYVQGYQLLN